VEDRVDEDRRVYRGIAALLGWDWLGSTDPDKPVVAAGEALPFRLFWEYLGKFPEELFFFRLVGPDERVWAEGISEPVSSENGDPATWRDGQIITEEGDLPIPVGTPPGEYRLQVGFYTQAPAVAGGELIFDLPPDDAWVQVLPPVQPVAVTDLPLRRAQNAQLAELRLLGTTAPEAPLTPGEPWTVNAYWQSEVTPRAAYRARLSLVDGDGHTRWDWGAAPLVDFYPPPLWTAGEVVRSQLTVVPSSRTPGGEYDMVLTLLNELGQPVGQTTLGPVQVEGRIRSFGLPEFSVPVGAVIGDAIELLGFSLQSPGSELRPGDELMVELAWRALATLNADYTVTVQLLGPDGQVYGQQDDSPLAGDAPTSTWSPGEVLDDAYQLNVAPDAPPGEYQLIVAVYLLETGERLPVRGGRDALVLDRLDVVP
jgi:hypothetical protein